MATATVDCRVPPGREQAFRSETEAVLGPAIEAEWRSLAGVSTSFDGDLPAPMAAAIATEDPGARLPPYLLPAGTDAKSFARLGIRNFGFAPLRLPAELGLHHPYSRRRRAGCRADAVALDDSRPTRREGPSDISDTGSFAENHS